MEHTGAQRLPAVEENQLRTQSSIQHIAVVQRLKTQHDACCQMSHHVLWDGALLFEQGAVSWKVNKSTQKHGNGGDAALISPYFTSHQNNSK